MLEVERPSASSPTQQLVVKVNDNVYVDCGILVRLKPSSIELGLD